MFTGLIDHSALIVNIESLVAGTRLTLATTFNKLTLGESIAVDGACLTVADIHFEKQRLISFDISPETQAVTTLGNFQQDRRVNLERALQVGDRLGGHFVAGHVDAMATVRHCYPQGDFLCVGFTNIDQTAEAWLMPKGSVTINGVSLTINQILPMGFEVMLIPETLAHTNLGQLEPGQLVNIEYDMLAKMVAHQIKFAQLKELTLSINHKIGVGSNPGAESINSSLPPVREGVSLRGKTPCN